MFNSSQGAFGAPPGFQDYSNIAGLNYAGAQNAPNMRNSFGSSMQFAFNSPSYYSPTLTYQNPRYTMQDYGVKHAFKANVLGFGYGGGHNALEYGQAKAEYKEIFQNNLFGAATGLVGTVGSIMSGGTLATASSGMSMAAPLYSYAKNQNYEDSQFSNYLSGGTVNKDGGMGFTGKQNTELTKYIRKLSSDDHTMNNDEFKDVLSTFKQSGGMDTSMSLGDLKGVARKVSGAIKSISDFIGSSDFHGMAKELANFTKMGFSIGGASNAIKRSHTAARIAGISDTEMKDRINTYIVDGGPNADKRVMVNRATSDAMLSKSLMAMGNLGTSFNDKRVLSSALRDVSSIEDSFTSVSTGLNGSGREAFLLMEAKSKGITKSEDYSKFRKKYFKMSASEKNNFYKNSETAKSGKSKNVIFDDTLASAFVDSNKELLDGLGSSNDGKKALIQTVIDRLGKDTSYENILSTVNNTFRGQKGFNKNSVSLMARMVQKGVKSGNLDFMDVGQNAGKGVFNTTEALNAQSRLDQRAGMWNSIVRNTSQTWNSAMSTAGFSGSETIQDDYRAKIAPGKFNKDAKARSIASSRMANMTNVYDIINSGVGGDNISSRSSTARKLGRDGLISLQESADSQAGVEAMGMISSGGTYEDYLDNKKSSHISKKNFRNLKSIYKESELKKRNNAYDMNNTTYSGPSRDDIVDAAGNKFMRGFFQDDGDSITRMSGRKFAKAYGTKIGERGMNVAASALAKTGMDLKNEDSVLLQSMLASGMNDKVANEKYKQITGNYMNAPTKDSYREAKKDMSSMTQEQKNQADKDGRERARKTKLSVITDDRNGAVFKDSDFLKQIAGLGREELTDLKDNLSEGYRKDAVIRVLANDDSSGSISQNINKKTSKKASNTVKELAKNLEKSGMSKSKVANTMAKLSKMGPVGRAEYISENGLNKKVGAFLNLDASSAENSDEKDDIDNAFENYIKTSNDSYSIIKKKAANSLGISGDMYDKATKSSSFSEFKKLNPTSDIGNELYKSIRESASSLTGMQEEGAYSASAVARNGTSTSKMTSELIGVSKVGFENVVDAIETLGEHFK